MPTFCFDAGIVIKPRARCKKSVRICRIGNVFSCEPAVPGSFYGFIPAFEGAIKLPGMTPSYGAAVPKPAPVDAVDINSRCFTNATATAVAAGNDPTSGAPQFTIMFQTSGMINTTCDEIFLLGTVADVQFLVVDAVGTHNVTMTAPDTPTGAAEWAAREGVRVFRFYSGVIDTIGQLLDTVELFIPSLSEPTLDANSMKLNRQLMLQYANLPTFDRPAQYTLTGIDPSLINTGDFLAISRADGLGTFEQLGTGEATSHTAVAVRLGPERALFVVESTDTTSYWPNPNIQKTAWAEWIDLAMAANYTVALLQMREELRAPDVWNQSAVEDHIAYLLGYPYGYHNFLWTFQDVPGGNFPKPLDWHALEVVVRLIEDIDPSITERFIVMAMNFRLSGGKTASGETTLTGVYNAAAKQGMTFGDLYSMPEQDAWIYPDGPSMVCDVFVCSVYKAAGLYRHFGVPDDQINCVEDTNWDVYALNFFNDDPTQRPAICQQADPGSPYCYVMGAYTIDLKGFNTVTPYPHMAEHCSAQWPNYTRPANC